MFPQRQMPPTLGFKPDICIHSFYQNQNQTQSLPLSPVETNKTTPDRIAVKKNQYFKSHCKKRLIVHNLAL